MIDLSWNFRDDERDPEQAGSSRPLLTTLHYLRNSLRRGWRIWLSATAVGVALGLMVAFLFPPPTKGTVTVLMAHPPAVDPSTAMATDVSILNTREVAVRTVEEGGLNISPDALMARISAEPATSEILTISVSGPSSPLAIAWTKALTTSYLEFRAEQLRSLTSGLVAGYERRIAAAQSEVNTLNGEFARVSAQGVNGQSRSTDILTRRSQLNSQIYQMQQAMADASLGSEAAITASHVIDPPRLVRGSMKRATVLDAGSGLILGLFTSVGFVLFRALTAGRVRRRHDVAIAMGAPVRFSTTSSARSLCRSVRPLSGASRRSGSGSRASEGIEPLVRGLESAVSAFGTPNDPYLSSLIGGGKSDPDPSGVALVAIGDAAVGAAVIAMLAERLQHRGSSVFVVDLGATGALASLARPQGRSRHSGSGATPRPDHPAIVESGSAGLVVFRPSGPPTLARGPRGAGQGTIVDLPSEPDWRLSWQTADVVLVLAEVDPGIDAENLHSWVGTAVPLVAAGGATPELLETTGELLRAAGLSLPYVMMVGADDTDESLGVVGPFALDKADVVSQV